MTVEFSLCMAVMTCCAVPFLTFSVHLVFKPIEWSQAIALRAKAVPFIGEILDAAFVHAQAVVVLLTGDDEARLRDSLQLTADAEYEKNLSPQSRQNVLFEAGLALGLVSGQNSASRDWQIETIQRHRRSTYHTPRQLDRRNVKILPIDLHEPAAGSTSPVLTGIAWRFRDTN